MVSIEDAINDLTHHITFEDDGEACTTESEVIIILESQKLTEDKLESDKRTLAEFIIKNWHSCPIPVEVKCKCGFQQNGCIECLLRNLDFLNLPKEC